MKSIFAVITVAVPLVMTMFLHSPQVSDDIEARAQAAASLDDGPVPAIVGKAAPLSPAPSQPAAPKVEPTPAPVPAAIPEGYEIYHEKVCNGTTCVMVPRLRPIAKAAKAVGSVLVAPARAVQAIRSAGCDNVNCTCDPCECDGVAAAYSYATDGAVVEYRSAPVRSYFANNQPVRTVIRGAGRGVARGATAPVRLIQRIRCR